MVNVPRDGANARIDIVVTLLGPCQQRSLTWDRLVHPGSAYAGTTVGSDPDSSTSTVIPACSVSLLASASPAVPPTTE